ELPGSDQPAGERLLLLADGQALTVGLLGPGGADRPGVVAGLHPGDPQRRLVVGVAPQALVRRDPQVQAGLPHLVRGRGGVARAPRGQVVRQPGPGVEPRAVERLPVRPSRRPALRSHRDTVARRPRDGKTPTRVREGVVWWS